MKALLLSFGLLFSGVANAAIIEHFTGFNQVQADARYVNIAGDTMTGPLTTTSMTVVGGMTVDTASNTLVVDSVNHAVTVTGPLAVNNNDAAGSAITATRNTSAYSLSLKNTGAGVSMSIDSASDATNRPAYINWLRGSVLKFATGIGGGGNNFVISTASVSGSVSAPNFVMTPTGNIGIGTTAPATKLHISSGTITMIGTDSPATGGALCLNAANAMSKCTSAVDASGNCTCP